MGTLSPYGYPTDLIVVIQSIHQWIDPEEGNKITVFYLIFDFYLEIERLRELYFHLIFDFYLEIERLRDKVET